LPSFSSLLFFLGTTLGTLELPRSAEIRRCAKRSDTPPGPRRIEGNDIGMGPEGAGIAALIGALGVLLANAVVMVAIVEAVLVVAGSMISVSSVTSKLRVEYSAMEESLESEVEEGPSWPVERYSHS
jgi:hypothetical protein